MAQKHAAENLPLKTPPKNAAEKPPKKNPPPGPAGPAGTVFHIREAMVCGQLQMSKDEVRHRREHFLTQGKHWELIDKRVQYSAIGLEVLLGTRTAVLPAAQDKRPAAGDSAPARPPIALLLEKNPTHARLEFKGKLIVWAAPPRNTKVVVCYLPGTDPYNPLNLVALRVRDNKNFLRGMEIPPEARPGKPLPPGPQVKVTPVSGRDDVFDLSGPTPRQRGRW